MIFRYNPAYVDGWKYSAPALKGRDMFIKSLSKQTQDVISVVEVSYDWNRGTMWITFSTYYQVADGEQIAHTVQIDDVMEKSAECIFQTLKDSKLEEFLTEKLCSEEGKKELAKIARHLAAFQNTVNQQ